MGDGVYETNDSGNAWQEILELRNVGLRNFHSPRNYLGYSVGNLGLVYKYIDTTIVPVELNSFTANMIDNKVILNWSTSSELNNKGFEIERSTDKTNWKVIGFIEGNGTTTEINNYFFIDDLFENNSQKLFYRLKQIDLNGSFEYYQVIEVEVGTPSEFSLSQNYPNPFNSETIIDYRIPEETWVNISLYDVTGRKLKELVNEKKQPGNYTIKLKGGELSSGIYLYRLITGSGYTAVKKIMILK